VFFYLCIQGYASLDLKAEIINTSDGKRLASTLLGLAFLALILQFMDLLLLALVWVFTEPTTVFLAAFSEVLHVQIFWLAVRGVSVLSESNQTVSSSYCT
jgi:hypothetical protein